MSAPRYRHGLYSRDLVTRALAWAAVLRGEIEAPRYRRPDLAALTLANGCVAPEDRRVALLYSGAERAFERAWARLPDAVKTSWLALDRTRAGE